MIKAIKQANPTAVVLATFHLTEIWEEDLVAPGKWLPDKCLLRNTDGSPCSWWAGMVYSNNMFVEECFEAGVQHALAPMPALVAAGVDGVFLDGVVNYNLGCKQVDVNCTTQPCQKQKQNSTTPLPKQPTPAALEAQWSHLFAEWFGRLKAHFPQLLWVNNLLDSLQPTLLPLSNGRMYEGTATVGIPEKHMGEISPI